MLMRRGFAVRGAAAGGAIYADPAPMGWFRWLRWLRAQEVLRLPIVW